MGRNGCLDDIWAIPTEGLLDLLRTIVGTHKPASMNPSAWFGNEICFVTTVPTPAPFAPTAPTPLGVENKGLTRTKYP